MQKQRAFTLIELLVTSSVTALLMLAVSSLFITFLATAYKSRISQNLRESGNNAMKQMVEMVRSSSEITSTCASDAPLAYIDIIGQDGLSTKIIEEEDRIASVSAEHTLYLTEEGDHPNFVSKLLFTCYPTPEGKKYVEISFTLKAGSNEISDSARSTTLDFSSGLATRN